MFHSVTERRNREVVVNWPGNASDSLYIVHLSSRDPLEPPTPAKRSTFGPWLLRLVENLGFSREQLKFGGFSDLWWKWVVLHPPIFQRRFLSIVLRCGKRSESSGKLPQIQLELHCRFLWASERLKETQRGISKEFCTHRFDLNRFQWCQWVGRKRFILVESLPQRVESHTTSEFHHCFPSINEAASRYLSSERIDCILVISGHVYGIEWWI